MRPQVPGRFERLSDIGLGADDLFRDATDSIRACADVVQLGGGHGAAVASDTSGVAGGVGVLEAWDRCKVEGGKGTRFAQRMPKDVVSLPDQDIIDAETHGLGIAERSSKDDASGI